MLMSGNFNAVYVCDPFGNIIDVFLDTSKFVGAAVLMADSNGVMGYKVNYLKLKEGS
jgi:hypothetical protein